MYFRDLYLGIWDKNDVKSVIKFEIYQKQQQKWETAEAQMAKSDNHWMQGMGKWVLIIYFLF